MCYNVSRGDTMYNFGHNDEQQAKAGHGKKLHHRIKPYIVLQYLLKNTDENNVVSANEISAYLREHCDIYAERRSIYPDIEEINKVAVMLEEDCTIWEAEEILDEDEERKLAVYDEHKKGYYIRQRHFDMNDIRLLAECIYSSKSITEDRAKRLVDVVCEFVSCHQAEKIKHNAFLTDRVKTNNKSVLNNISTINDAMSSRIDGEVHTPEKISFKYLKYTIDDVNNQVERRHGERYIVSPYQLLINDGNYYLLAYDDKKGKMITYRVDRMKDVRYTNIPREGEDVFKNIDLRTYTQRVFSMYGGEERRVELQFIPPLLDTIIERFGTKDAYYSKSGERHYKVMVKVEVSDQFFGWLLGFGKRVQILYPEDIRERFAAYIDGVREMY